MLTGGWRLVGVATIGYLHLVLTWLVPARLSLALVLLTLPVAVRLLAGIVPLLGLTPRVGGAHSRQR